MPVKLTDRVVHLALDDLVQKHGCHTVILCGSRSRGIGIREQGGKFRDARLVEGKFLDAFVYPECDIAGHESDLIRIRNGTVLIEKEA